MNNNEKNSVKNSIKNIPIVIGATYSLSIAVTFSIFFWNLIHFFSIQSPIIEHIGLMSISIFSIIFSFVCSKYISPYNNYGISIGGCILLMHSIGCFWDNYSDLRKIIVAGIGLVILLISPTKILNIIGSNDKN